MMTWPLNQPHYQYNMDTTLDRGSTIQYYNKITTIYNVIIQNNYRCNMDPTLRDAIQYYRVDQKKITHSMKMSSSFVG